MCTHTHTHTHAHTHTHTHTHRFLEIAQPFEDHDIPKYLPRFYPSNADDLVASAALPATPLSPGAQVELNSRETTAMKQRSMLHLDAPVLHLDASESSLALNLARSSEPNKGADVERSELERRLSEERGSQLLECDVTRCVTRNLVTSLVMSQHPALAQRPQKHEQELRELKRKCDYFDDDDPVYCSPLEMTIEQAHATNSRERERELEGERERRPGWGRID